jgi:aminopeptidase YwaD
MTHPVRLSLLALTLTCLVLRAPSQAPATDAAAIDEGSIRGHMEFLASEALQGRGSGTRDEWLAATYIAAQFRRWGLEPLGDGGGHVQEILTGRSRVIAAPTLSAADAVFRHGEEILVQRLGAPAATAPLHKYRSDRPVPEGSIVLMPADSAASVTGAAVVLAPATEADLARWERFGSRLPSLGRGRRRGAAGGSGAPSTTRIILDEVAYSKVSALPDGTTLEFAAAVQPGKTWNAVGQLTGSDPAKSAQVILLSSHLDHLGVRGSGEDAIYNGADDDASGTTAVLELARAIANGPRPRRTVMFACFGSEESGGFGARHFLDDPPVTLERIVANLEFEMIGRPDPMVPEHTLWLTGYERTDLGPELARHGAKIVADPHPEQNFFARSDNIQLARRGVVAQTVSSFGLHPDYHRASDAIRSILPPTLWLANSDFEPEWVEGMQPATRRRR